MQQEHTYEVECLEQSDDCQGTVEYRMPLNGKSLPRCDFHWEKRLDVQERINRWWRGLLA